MRARSPPSVRRSCAPPSSVIWSDMKYSRRAALKSLASGFGYLAFAGLAHEASVRGSGDALAPRPTHFPARAKRVIFLCMNGGPSHVDLFDYKPELQRRAGETMFGRGGARLLGSPFRFARHGTSGQWISELLPHLTGHADELCMITGMHTDLPNH